MKGLRTLGEPLSLSSRQASGNCVLPLVPKDCPFLPASVMLQPVLHVVYVNGVRSGRD